METGPGGTQQAGAGGSVVLSHNCARFSHKTGGSITPPDGWGNRGMMRQPTRRPRAASSNCGFVPGAEDGPVEHSIHVFCFSLSLRCSGDLLSQGQVKGRLTQRAGPGQEASPCYFPVWPLAVCRRRAGVRGWLLLPGPRLDPAALEVASALQ